MAVISGRIKNGWAIFDIIVASFALKSSLHPMLYRQSIIMQENYSAGFSVFVDMEKLDQTGREQWQQILHDALEKMKSR